MTMIIILITLLCITCSIASPGLSWPPHHRGPFLTAAAAVITATLTAAATAKSMSCRSCPPYPILVLHCVRPHTWICILGTLLVWISCSYWVQNKAGKRCVLPLGSMRFKFQEFEYRHCLESWWRAGALLLAPSPRFPRDNLFRKFSDRTYDWDPDSLVSVPSKSPKI